MNNNRKVKECLHTLRTRFAPRLKPCAETARLSGQKTHRRQPGVPTNLPCGGTSARPSSNPDMQHLIHTCLILQCLQPLSSLCDLCDVFSHNTNGVINLGLNSGCLGVSLAWASGGRSRGAISRQVGVVRFRPAPEMNTLVGIYLTTVTGGS